MHKYKIFQDKDGRWKTTLPDEVKKNGRRLIAKKNLEDLENIVISYYEEQEKLASQPEVARIGKDITLEELYPIWLKSRILEVKSIRTIKKNDQDWRRYYLNTDIIKVPMNKLTVNDLKDWAHSMIDKYEFNKRAYYNMIVIIKKCYEYLSDEGICENTWSRVKINTKKLRREIKKENITEVYFSDEKMKIIHHALRAFALRPWNIGVLTIPFLFMSGLRIGEVVSLRYSDLTDNEIIVRRNEVNNYEYDEEKSKFVYKGKQIVDYLKTDAGERTVPYTKGAKEIIDMVKKASEYYEYYDNDFIFCPASKRLVSNSIDHLLYTYCEKVGISKKSAHKIRKTYISQVINNGVDLDTVCRISGHVDLKTTFQSYYYSLERKDDIYEKFDEMFCNVV